MSRTVFYGLLFLVLVTFETSFLSSLPFPFHIFPIIPAVAIWLYHQASSRIGWWYLLAWGIWYDFFDLSLWSSKTVVALGMMVAILYISGRIFSHRSLYGLMGLGGTLWIIWSLIEALFHFLSPAPLTLAFDGFVSGQIAILIELLLSLAILFWMHLRLRERLQRL